MKLAGFAIGSLLAASLVACGAGNNGGWVTKGGWDSSSQAAPAQQPAAPESKESTPLSANDLQNPYNPYTTPPPPAKKLVVDKDSPYQESDSSKAKTEKKQ